MTLSTFQLCCAAVIFGSTAVLMVLPDHEPSTNQRALAACIKLHPERYCRLTYAPSTIPH